MDLEVTPEPSPGELEALRDAVRRQLLPATGARESPWWREGVRENTSEEEADVPGP